MRATRFFAISGPLKSGRLAAGVDPMIAQQILDVARVTAGRRLLLAGKAEPRQTNDSGRNT